jgi:hypothetical protein
VFRLDAQAEGISRTLAPLSFRGSSDGGGSDGGGSDGGGSDGGGGL